MKQTLCIFFVILSFASCEQKKIEIKYFPYKNEAEKKIEYSFEVNSSGKKCGKFVWFSTTGDTLETASFKDNELNGIVRTFYSNGHLESESNWIEDVTDGEKNEYYRNGKLKFSLVYKMDKLWKINSVHDSLGNSLEFGNLVNGIGSVKKFYPDGKIEETGNFVDGKRYGYWKSYTNTGVLMDSVFYDKNNPSPDTEFLLNLY